MADFRTAGAALLLFGVFASPLEAQATTPESMIGASHSFGLEGPELATVEDDGDSRLKWVLIGAGAGAGATYVIGARFLLLYDDGVSRRNWILGGAAFGAIAGFILSSPRESDEGADLRIGAFTAYFPPSGGVGLRLPIPGLLNPTRR